MRNRVEGLVIALNRAWEEAAPAIAALQAKLKEPATSGLDEDLLKQYETFRLAVLDLSMALKDVDLAMGQLAAEKEKHKQVFKEPEKPQ